MNMSVYDVLEKDINQWLEGQSDRILWGNCTDYVDYVKSAERYVTAQKLLELIKEALQRLEKQQND